MRKLFLFFCDEHHTILSATKSIVILSFSATEKNRKDCLSKMIYLCLMTVFVGLITKK
ncbi:hypothetical protein FORC31_p056 (plasmid) [Escherichia coli]|nr:hypothetical protein FORC31_p056 [Escherichia coli]